LEGGLGSKCEGDVTNAMFIVVWEFRIRPGAETGFEKLYGPEGDWTRLFRQDPNFIKTDLIQDVHDRHRYLTLDVWESRKAYDDFRGRTIAEYRNIDSLGESLTTSEREIGRFERAKFGQE
jgi:heme-degrading monooxygenase HmoA